MNLNLTNEQFLTLLEAVHAAAHVCHTEEISKLEEELLKTAVAAGVPGIVFDEDRLALGNIITKRLHDKMNEYDEMVFWRALAEEMADKDLRAKLGSDAVDALTDEEYFQKAGPLIDEYDEEFKRHGTERLTMDYRLLIKKI